MNEILKADFRNARIGDRVKCLFYGDGEITTIDKKLQKPIFVTFDGSDIEQSGFDFNGRHDKDACNTLFYHFETQFPTIEACTRPLPTIEVDEKVLVWDRGIWRHRHFSRFGAKRNIGCYSHGATKWTEVGDTDFYSYWKLASDPTINSGNLEEIEGENGKG